MIHKKRHKYAYYWTIDLSWSIIIFDHVNDIIYFRSWSFVPRSWRHGALPRPLPLPFFEASTSLQRNRRAIVTEHRIPPHKIESSFFFGAPGSSRWSGAGRVFGGRILCALYIPPSRSLDSSLWRPCCSVCRFSTSRATLLATTSLASRSQLEERIPYSQ